MNWKAQREMDKDVEDNHELHAALGGCSCDECKDKTWYTGE